MRHAFLTHVGLSRPFLPHTFLTGGPLGGTARELQHDEQVLLTASVGQPDRLHHADLQTGLLFREYSGMTEVQGLQH